MAAGFVAMFPGARPLIGMVHLPPLPGYAACPGMSALVRHVEAEVRRLESLGYDGVLVENENDQPHRVTATPEVTAAMSVVTAAAVAAARRIVVGVEILLNDPYASLAVAKAAGARFIRTDYFVDRMARDEYGGEMAIDAKAVMAYRAAIDAADVAVLADVQVKYARMIEPRPIGDSAVAAREAGADAVIVTGSLTGVAPVTHDLAAAAAAVRGHPVLIGSGLTPENARELLAVASGAIVGTGIMRDGRIDEGRAAALIAARDGIA